MPLNTTYAEQEAGFAGMLYGTGPKQVESFVQGEASAEVPFGAVVAQGTAGSAGTPDKAILMVDANSVPVGVLIHSHAYNRETQLGTTGVKPTNVIDVMRKGRIYALFEGSVTKGNNAFIRHTAGVGGSQKGALRADADTASAVVCRGISFAETKSGGGYVLVNVDMDNVAAVSGLT